MRLLKVFFDNEIKERFLYHINNKSEFTISLISNSQLTKYRDFLTILHLLI